MAPDDFNRLQALLASRAGLRLTRERTHLAAHRLAPVARREGFDSVDDLMAALGDRPAGSLAWNVIEAMLNAETWFRRDRMPFDVFESELIPALSRARPNGLIRIWSAGCSTGQEAYSLAMTTLGRQVPARILASDLSGRAVQRARAGLYSGFEIQRGLRTPDMLRWFAPHEDQWLASEALRQTVTFERENLLDLPPLAERFDVIFCRYVLGDMDPGHRGAVVEALERRLADDGVLFLGQDERLDGDTIAFRPVRGRAGLFVKAPTSIRRAA